jgi:hypothetical protein
MTEPAPTKAAVERVHDTRIESGACPDGWAFQAFCDTPGCDWQSLTYGTSYPHATREYLAENAASEHRRAMAGWPGTAPAAETPIETS